MKTTRSCMNDYSLIGENHDARIEGLSDWRGEILAHLRALIHDADPDVEEEWKWEKPKSPGTLVWSHDGIICTGESIQAGREAHSRRGASIDDPKKLFNSSLEGNVRRAIDFHEGDKVNATAFKQLIRAAVAANSAALAKRAARLREQGRRGYALHLSSLSPVFAYSRASRTHAPLLCLLKRICQVFERRRRAIFTASRPELLPQSRQRLPVGRFDTMIVAGLNTTTSAYMPGLSRPRSWSDRRVAVAGRCHLSHGFLELASAVHLERNA